MRENSYVEAPPTWVVANLGSLISISYGKALSASIRSNNGPIPVVGSSGILGYHNRALVDGPCLVVGRKGAAGAVHLITQPSWAIDTAYYIQPPSGIDLRYLFYFLCYQQLEQLDKSTAIPSLSRDDLYKVNAYLAPESEQRRIVEKIEELLSDLDAGVAELKAAQRKLVQYRQSLLKGAVEGTLTADWRAARAQSGEPQETGSELLQRILTERRTRWETRQLAKFAEQGKVPPKDWNANYPEPAVPGTTGLPVLPEGWIWASVDQLSDMVRNGLPQKPSTERIGYPILRINAVRPMSVSLDEVRYLSLSEKEASSYFLHEGDLLATRYNGSVDFLGVFGVVRGLREPMVHPDKLIRIKPVLDAPLADWIEICASTGVSRKHIVGRVKTTAGQTGISGEDIKKMPIPLPPVLEQLVASEMMAAALANIASQGATVEYSLRQSAAQRKNILKAAFTGKLVPQDPNDEPASVLLERIRAERVAADAKRAGKNTRKT
ncbi:restriction endonuclease subunit S [Xanthomonas graminis]|uniref:restriction endonuclease subunit S n=1 Tax=Xanthomonas graminis TaxID=3390026 RepID=UPI000A71D838|nr:restriction endonuclease subunit S [Xanthomonas translucens]